MATYYALNNKYESEVSAQSVEPRDLQNIYVTDYNTGSDHTTFYQYEYNTISKATIDLCIMLSELLHIVVAQSAQKLAQNIVQSSIKKEANNIIVINKTYTPLVLEKINKY